MTSGGGPTRTAATNSSDLRQNPPIPVGVTR